MELEAEKVITYASGIAIPIVIWGWSLLKTSREILEMHKNPDKHGFGSELIVELLESHIKETQDARRDQLEVNRDLKHAMKEMAHYSKWLATLQANGKAPPPYIRNGD